MVGVLAFTSLTIPHENPKEKFGQINLPGEPILVHLLCCEGFAVGNHSCILHAAQLQQPQLVNKSD